MAVTTTSSLSNSARVLLNKAFQMASTGAEYYDQLTDTREAMGARRGITVEWPIIEQMDVATSTLSQTSDITPVALDDTNASITIAEYGNGVQISSLLDATSFIEVGTAAAKANGINMTRTLDVVVRDVTVGGTNVMRVRNVAARTSLTAAGHRLDYGFITDLKARAMNWNIPVWEDGKYVAVITPTVTAELQAIPQWQSVEGYRGEESGIFTGENFAPFSRN